MDRKYKVVRDSDGKAVRAGLENFVLEAGETVEEYESGADVPTIDNDNIKSRRPPHAKAVMQIDVDSITDPTLKAVVRYLKKIIG